jgi:hypothetical protein
MTTEFCPKCHYPLDESDDDSRLCVACQWFGDKSEVCKKLPDPTPIELAFIQLVTLYRDVCRLELLAEQLAEGHPEHQRKLTYIKMRVSHARHSLLHLFRGTRK